LRRDFSLNLSLFFFISIFFRKPSRPLEIFFDTNQGFRENCAQAGRIIATATGWGNTTQLSKIDTQIHKLFLQGFDDAQYETVIDEHYREFESR
jgi:hypothetical protein